MSKKDNKIFFAKINPESSQTDEVSSSDGESSFKMVSTPNMLSKIGIKEGKVLVL